MSTNTRKFLLYFVALIITWTLLVLAHVFLQHIEYKNAAMHIAVKEADLTFLKDSLYRRWSASHGGVYVFVTEDMQPNPYLENIDNRDIITENGKKLTLVNPAFMTRQVFELADSKVPQGHLISDIVLNPANKPDKWEQEAFAKIKSGLSVYSGIDVVDGVQYLRFMKPFITEEGCLKCHAFQGYEVGDIRGGISVAIPLKGYLDAFMNKSASHMIVSFLIWFFGIAVLFYAYLKMTAMMRKEENLNNEKDILMQEFNHRIKNNLQIISSIIDVHMEKSCTHDKNEVLQDIQDRMISMAHMHSMFASGSSTGIDSEKYISKIYKSFCQTHSLGRNSDVEFISDVDSFTLSGVHALSCGLILNELLTNSFKHAFKDSVVAPKIFVTFKRVDGKTEFTYRDNGVGFDFDTASKKPDSYGLMLVSSMAEKLNAVSQIKGEGGMFASFTF
ncbi:signal transduction histidine kinase [Denitrovibrio acetiphilus DSM 12809]|uniref:histidine kinase n=1 Tax=Denitrovibrio acetiphilus (strain DSM 12809 / NBRC 114555 / N2460) TaxID=522772 RepID=D4H8R1_DENA2|nr:histidine kinase dimerization/phosphoacceptor domain -containing protein [Denitrovibrio acetiphilus]ADD68410.1 signal transduction histidine kinase [Denitrovibrio acetiphilus DSM 12809]